MTFLANALDVGCSINEIFWLYRWVDLFLTKRNRFLKTRHIEKILEAVYVIMVYLLNHVARTSAYTMVVIMVVNVVMVMCFWNSDFVHSLALVGGYFLMLFIIGNIEISITGFIGGERLIRETTLEQGMPRVIYLLIGAPCWFFLNWIMTRFVKKKSIHWNGVEHLTYVTVIGFIGCAFIGSMMLRSFNAHINAIWYISLALLLIAVFCVYYAIRQKNEKFMIAFLAAKNEMLEKNYIQINESYNANAKLYHDVNHHLNAIYQLLASGEVDQAMKYIEKLEIFGEKRDRKVHSGINVLDAVFQDAFAKAEKKNITMSVETPMLPCDIGIENGDICSLFANLLGNALEASSEEITVQIKKNNKTLFAVIKNDYNVEPIKRDGKFMTHKKDKCLHGWGTQIINQIVQKYDGSVEYETKNGYFTVYVMVNEK